MSYKNFKDRKEYQAFYRETNREKLKEWHKNWYEKNKEAIILHPITRNWVKTWLLQFKESL